MPQVYDTESALKALWRWLTGNGATDPDTTFPTVKSTLQTVDVQIGAVELKNDADDTRAKVQGTNPTSSTVGLVTRAYPAPTEEHLGEVGGNIITVAVEKTRPADTTAYAANDAVSNSTSAPTVWTFANAGRVAGGSGYIVGARIATDQSTNVARLRLHLFHTAPTAVNDNAPQTILYANVTKREGYVTFDAMFTGGAGSTMAVAQDQTMRIPYKCDGGDTNIYALLETLDAFTPASGQKFTIELDFDRN